MSLYTPSPRAAAGASRHCERLLLCATPDDAYAARVVETALVRSFTPLQVAAQLDAHPREDAACTVWINPPEDTAAALKRVLACGGKALVFGRLGPRVADVLGLEWLGAVPRDVPWAACDVNAAAHHDESPAAIEYPPLHPLAAHGCYRRRPLCRFDFSDEWNNLGFGRIRAAGDCWSLQTAALAPQAAILARLSVPGERDLVYAAIYETARGAALWFNRPVGPVDSLEWRLVEAFVSDYRPDDLPCLPRVCEVPAGYRAAACARLDCDEAVASARPLVDLYRACGVPLSLALPTGRAPDDQDMRLLRDVLKAGGSVVPHSVHHYANWGGSYEQALAEARQSRDWIESHLPAAAPARYAVSPFHQNPPYAVSALADCGYAGFVGGIIANDPEYLLGRAGRVPFASRSIISHSAQCMLHGDCFRRYGDSMDVYTGSFARHVAAGAIFGYLDHPFSERYQYGWHDEATRVDAHRRLIDGIQSHGHVWWASLTALYDFLLRRDAVSLAVDAGGRLSIDALDAEPRVQIGWKGRELAA